MSKKLDNVRVVTFSEDYKSKTGKVLYAKGRTVAMHVRTINKMIARGAKATVKPFDAKKAIQRKKEELAEAEKKQREAMYLQ